MEKEEESDDDNKITTREITTEIAWVAMKAALKHSYKKGLLTESVYKECLAGKFPTHSCVYSGYKPCKKGSKYTQVRHKGIKYYCHRVAGVIADLNIDGFEVSHLCHDPGCFNPAHLTAESGEINKSRLCCKLFSKVESYRCPHVKPPCWGCVSCYSQVDSTASYWDSPNSPDETDV